MTEYALPIEPIPEADMTAVLDELNQCVADIERDDYLFGGELGYHVYVWFNRRTPIYAGVGAPSKPRRYLEHWTKAGSEGMEYSQYLATHKMTIWPALAASNLNNAVAHSLERLLIAKYRRRADGGTLFNHSFGKFVGRETRGEDTFGLKRGAERAKVEESNLSKFQRSNRPHACWQTAKAENVVIPDDFRIRVLVDRNPKAGRDHEFQFSLYEGVSTVGEYRNVYATARLKGVPARQKLDKDIYGNLFWDSCCQHPEGPFISLIPPLGGKFCRRCIFPRGSE